MPLVILMSNDNIVIGFEGTSSWGSGDAYVYLDKLSIKTPPTCFEPTILGVTNLTDVSVDLAWTTGGATTWDIELGVDGFTPIGTPTTEDVTNPYTTSSLTLDTGYDFYVRDVSDWVGPFSFTTLIFCPKPTVLTAANITMNSADLGWTIGDSETAWNIEVGAVGFEPGAIEGGGREIDA